MIYFHFRKVNREDRIPMQSEYNEYKVSSGIEFLSRVVEPFGRLDSSGCAYD